MLDVNVDIKDWASLADVLAAFAVVLAVLTVVAKDASVVAKDVPFSVIA